MVTAQDRHLAADSDSEIFLSSGRKGSGISDLAERETPSPSLSHLRVVAFQGRGGPGRFIFDHRRLNSDRI